MDFLFIEFNPDNNVSDQSQCTTTIAPGCQNVQYLEYDVSYNIGEDSIYCLTPIIEGCTNENAQNFNDIDGDGFANELTGDPQVDVNTDNGSCVGVAGCTDDTADNFDSSISAAVDDGSCQYWGCTNPNAANYDANATHNITSADDSGSPCVVLGCTDETALNYNDLDGDNISDPLSENDGFNVNVEDGSCIFAYIYGCMDPTAFNYDSLATINAPSADISEDPCEPFVYGCTDDTFVEYYDLVFSPELQYQISGPVNIPNQDTEPTSCVTPIIEGCTDASFIQYVDSANVYNASECINLLVVGCQLDTYLEYNPDANYGDSATYCITINVIGCMNPNYLEYDSLAIENNPDDCITQIVEGCTDQTAFNYNSSANVDDNTCIAIVLGCIDNGFDTNGNGQVTDIDGDGQPAFNYNSSANTDDGSCEAILEGCTNANFIEYWQWDEDNFTILELDPLPNTNIPIGEVGSCMTQIVEGCKDNSYTEFNVDANVSVTDSCITVVELGCTNEGFLEYDPLANTDDGSCLITKVPGCTDANYLKYYGFVDFIVPVDAIEYLTAVSSIDSIANVDDGSCVTQLFKDVLMNLLLITILQLQFMMYLLVRVHLVVCCLITLNTTNLL